MDANFRDYHSLLFKSIVNICRCTRFQSPGASREDDRTSQCYRSGMEQLLSTTINEMDAC